MDGVLQNCLKLFGFETNRLIQTFKPKPNLTKDQHFQLKKLKMDDSIKVCQADKGNAIVILDHHVYQGKMADILDDPVHFKKLTSDPTKSRERKLVTFLLKLHKEGLLEKPLYQFLRPSDARTPQLYGLVKIHKDGNPLRPIVSACSSFNYNLGKFLVWTIQPYLGSHSSFIKDSRDFVSKISNISSIGSKMASFDVSSLYTMVPVNEAIKLAIECIQNDSNPRFHLPSNYWLKCFEFSTLYCNFDFLNEHYDQVDGLSMGNPLAPPLANLFMMKVEEKALELALNHHPFSFTPTMWLRYVDDIFCILSDEELVHVNLFLNLLNSVHPAIKFTMEKEIDNQLNFLDVTCISTENSYLCSVYRKPTHTNLYVRWNSAHPPGQLLGIFNTLLFRAKSICSSALQYQEEREHLFNAFIDNGYPLKSLNIVNSKFEQKCNRPLGNQVPDNRMTTNTTAPVVSLVLPFVPGLSERIAAKWKFICKQNNLPLNTRVIYKPPKKLKNFFPYYNNPHVGRRVYKATCTICKKTYVGETGLDLDSRIRSHQLSQSSSIVQHCNQENHPFDQVVFDMLSYSCNANLRKIQESIFIRKLSPELNNSQGVFPFVFS